MKRKRGSGGIEKMLLKKWLSANDKNYTVSSECINVIAVYLFEQMCIIEVRLGELKSKSCFEMRG